MPNSQFRRKQRAAGFPCASLILLTLIFAGSALAQTSDTATIRGSVRDQNAALIVGAKVEIANSATGFRRDTVTDSDGNFVFRNVPLTGSYKLTATRDGFAPSVKEDVVLRAGEAAIIDFSMSVAGATGLGGVTVRGTTEGVQSDSAQLAIRLDLDKINATPVLNRKLTNLVELNSATRPARGTGDLFLNNYLFVANGNGRRQTNFSIDGSTGNDDWGRQTIFTNLPFSTIQEFTVITNPISAEFGRTAGNVVNVVTKSGTNDFGTDLVFMARPSGLQARPPLASRRTRDELLQFSGIVSGPIVRNKTHFLFGGELNSQQRSTVISSVLAPGTFDGKYKQSMLFARIDHQINDKNRFTGRFNLERFTDTNPADAVGGNNLPSAARTFERDTYMLQGTWNTVISASAVNDLRAVYLLGSPITQFAPANPGTQFIRPIATEGESRAALLTNKEFQIADTLSYITGDHLLRFGGDLEYSTSGGNGQEFGSGFVLGQFRFTNARASNPAIPTSALTIADAASFTQSFGTSTYRIKQWLWSAFVQDDWRAHRDVTINIGLRYERQSFTDDTNNFAPRIGVAYNVFGDAKTVIRASYGIFYSQLRANLGAQFSLGGPTGVFTFTATPGQLGFPTSLTALPSFPAGASLPARDVVIRPGRADYYSQFFDVSRLRGYPDALLNPMTHQATLGFERDLGHGYVIGADLVTARTTKIDRLLDLNAPSEFIPFITLPTATRTVAQANLTRPITPVANGFRRIQVVVNEGASDYDGLQVNLQKRMSGKYGFVLSYTLSKTTNTVEPDAGNGDPADVNRLGEFERGISLLHQRHRFVLSGSRNLPWGFVIGGVESIASGRPYAITAGVDINGDGSTADRPYDQASGNFLPRNSGKGSATYSTDLFLQKNLPVGERARLQFRVEAFNVFNYRNIYGRFGNYGNALVGTPNPLLGSALGGIANTDPGRELQFQFRFLY